MKRFLTFFMAVILVFGLAACRSNETPKAEGSEVPKEEGTNTLVVAITKDENSLSPFTYVSATGLTVNRLVYDTLFTTNLENEIVPWMVKDDYQVENNQIFTFNLLEGQKFHNGDPVDAEAVRFSFTYPADKGNSSQRKTCSAIDKIEVLDDLTIRFTLKQPDVNFLRDGFASMRIICPSLYQDVQNPESVTDSIGSGMYRLAEYKTGAYYILEAVPDYFKGTPTVKSLNMPIMGDSASIQQAMLAGEIAASVGTIGIEMVDVFKGKENMQIFSNADYAPLIVNMNCERPPFDQVDFRRAISYAVDVNTICNTLFDNYALTGTPGAIRSDLPYAIDTSYTHSPEKAIALLEGLGYTQIDANGIRLDKNGDPLSFEIITYSGNATRSRLCELMKEQLKAVGIDLGILSMDMDTADAYIWPDFEVANGRDYDMSAWGWGSSAGNSYNYLVSLCAGKTDIGTFNVCGYHSEKFDNILDSTTISSSEDMEAMLKELQKVVAEEVPLLTIGYADKIQVCNTDLYDGWQAGNGTNIVNIYSFLPQ